MVSRMKIYEFFVYGSIKLGFLGIVLYWFFENYEVVFGVVMFVCMVVSFIVYYVYKVILICNDECCKEEWYW